MTQLSITPNQRVVFDVLSEKQDYLVVSKPAGLSTQPGIKHSADTLLNGLFSVYGSALQNLGKKRDFGLLHRLDLATSGLLLVGRTIEGYDDLRAKFEKREVEKIYLAIVHGHLRHSGRVEHPIREVRLKGEKTAQLGPHPKAKSATTSFHPLDSSGGFSLVRCRIQSGRLHQIRIHLASLGHPIVGDFRYGRRSGQDKLLGRNRIGLHAFSLGFIPPRQLRAVHVKCPLPRDLQGFMAKIGLSD